MTFLGHRPVAYLGGLTRSDVHPLPGDD